MPHTSEDLSGLTRPNWSFHSTRLTSFFTSSGDFRQVHGHHQWMNGQEVLAMGSPVIEDPKTWQKESPGLAQFDKEHFFGTQGPRFSTAWHQSSSTGHAIVWSIVFLFAERNFRLCVNRNFDTIFDPVLPEPNRIFGLLNLSNKKVKFDGARCPFSTFLRLQGDHHCACAQKWCHFSFFSRAFRPKEIKALRPKMTKIASRGGGGAA